MSTLVTSPDLTGEKLYTYEDYAAIDDGNRYEVIDGRLYMMAAPNLAHQEILGELFAQFHVFLKGKPCRVFIAPCDVRLKVRSKRGRDTVVQPDLLVVCDTGKLGDGKYCLGAPDLALEVKSPSSSRMDNLIKFRAYKQAGVREYWIVDPEAKTVQVFMLQDGTPSFAVYGDEEKVPVLTVPGLEIDLTAVFGMSETAENAVQ